jgi:cation diffusion facilitator CzcD-associated flavoprotein CzcO
VAKKVSVFQRTPHWIQPRGDYVISDFRKAIYRHFPFWQRYWRRRYMALNETEYISNNFPNHEEHRKLTQIALDMMHKQLPDQPELWEKLTPKYPLGCKRVVVSDCFYPALNLPNVEIEASPIHSINAHTVRVVGTSGQAEDADSHYDLIVYATGFRANEFLYPMKIYGRNGRALHEMWKDGARSYLGICADDMPNLGIVLGPNTGLLHNSFILIIEAQSRYINGLIKPVLEARRQGGALSLRPRPQKTEEYNEKLQYRLKGFAANDVRCTNWYKTESGLITNLWPGMVLEYQQLMEQVNYEDYVTEGSSRSIVQDRPSYRVGRVVEEPGSLEKLSFAKIAILGISAVVGGALMQRLIELA